MSAYTSTARCVHMLNRSVDRLGVESVAISHSAESFDCDVSIRTALGVVRLPCTELLA
jgi:hypothetical protein